MTEGFKTARVDSERKKTLNAEEIFHSIKN